MTGSPSTNQVDAFSAREMYKWRDSFLRRIMLGAVILGFLAILATFLFPIDPILITVYVGAYLVVVAAAFIRMPYLLRAGILLFLIYVIAINNILKFGIGAGSGRLFLLALVVFGGLLVSARTSIFMFGLSMAAILVIGWLTVRGVLQSPSAEGIEAWLTSGSTFLLLSVTSIIGINSFQTEFERAQQRSAVAISSLQMERTQLEGKVSLRTQELEQKTSHLRASTAIARVSSQLEDINELMDSVATLTAQRFNLSHAGIFLLDDLRKIAFLQASSSETGKEMIARGFRVEVDKRSAINVVVEQARSYLVSSGSESLISRDIDFPRTRSRLLLPLIARGVVIGLMDLHSDEEQAFHQEDTETLQSLADLIAISIENVRLLNDTRTLVTQLETLTSYQSQEAWQKYSSRHAPSYQYTPAGIRPLYAPSESKEAPGLQIPLLLRGKAIGMISMRRKDNASTWTTRERELVEKIALQVALALDNSRLVEEAQKNAQRDQLIANVSNRVRETLDVDSVIRTAATELRRIFDLKEAEVTVGSVTGSTSTGTGSLIGRSSRRK